MAQIELKIEVNGDSSSETISGITQSQTGNNIGLKSGFPQTKSDGFEALSWVQNQEDPNVWELYFNADGNLANSKDGISGTLQSEENPAIFVWGKTDANGAKEITLTITGTNIDNIEIIGNKIANQFPVECIVDGTDTFYSDDNDWNIKLNTQSSSHTIKFTKWNRPNYNACISFIGIMVQYYTIDRYNGLKNLESLAESTPDPKSVVYGCLANSGSAEIVDVGGEIGDLINDKILDPSNVPMKVLVNGKEIQSHISIDSNYSNEQVFTIEFTNKLADLDGLKYQGYPYPETSKTAYELLTDVLQKLYGQSFDVDATMSSATKAKLQGISIEYPYIEANQTYRAVIDSICELAQLQMYAKDNGSIYFINARPMFEPGHSIIKIPRRNQFSKFTYDMFIKNKFDGVEMNECDVSLVTDYYTVVYSDDNVNTSSVEQTAITYSDLNTGFHNFDYATTVSTGSVPYAIAHTKIKPYYYTGTITIPKSSNYNLEKISNLQETLFNEGHPKFTVNCKKVEKSLSGVADCNNSVITSITYDAFTDNDFIGVDTGSYYEKTISVSKTAGIFPSVTAESETTISDASALQITDTGDSYEVQFTIICGWDETTLTGSGTVQSGFKPASASVTGTITRYKPISLSFSVYGDKRTISFEEVSASTSGIETKKSKVTLNDNTLLQDNILIDGNKLSSVIKTNILNDYRDGVRTANVTVCCTDYYDTNGNKVKNFDNGDMLEIGDYVKVLKDNDNESALKYSDGSDYLWRVTSRKFYYQGAPMVDLTLQELTYSTSGLFDSNGYQVYTWKELKDKGYVTITSGALSSSSGTLDGKLVVDEEVTQILENALLNQTSLTSLEIPSTVTTINTSSFASCIGLKSIIVSGDNNNFASEDGILYNKAKTSMWFVPMAITSAKIANTMTTLDSGKFDGRTSLTSLTIPQSVTMIVPNLVGSHWSSLTDAHFEDQSHTWVISGLPNGGGTVVQSAYSPVTSTTNAQYLKDYYAYYWTKNT